MHITSWRHEDLTYEEAYNTYAQRLFPMPGVPEPDWGGAWIAVEAGETVTPHAHDEKEMFFIVSGEGRMRIGTEERTVGLGDTIYITPFVDHCLTNTGQDRLVFLSIWWDEGRNGPPPPGFGEPAAGNGVANGTA